MAIISAWIISYNARNGFITKLLIIFHNYSKDTKFSFLPLSMKTGIALAMVPISRSMNIKTFLDKFSASFMEYGRQMLGVLKDSNVTKCMKIAISFMLSLWLIWYIVHINSNDRTLSLTKSTRFYSVIQCAINRKAFVCIII